MHRVIFYSQSTMFICGSRKFCQRGSSPTLTFFVVVFCLCLFVFFVCFFSVAEGKEDSKNTISGPLSANHLNAIEMAYRWRATLNVGLVALRFLRGSERVLLRNSIIL